MIELSNLVMRFNARRWVVAVALGIFFVLTLQGELASTAALLSALIVTLVAIVTPLKNIRVRKVANDLAIDRDAINAHLKLILNGIPEPLVLLKSQSNIIFANTAFINTFGPVAEGSPLMLRLRNPEIQQLIQSASSGATTDPIEFYVSGAEEKWFEASANVIGDNDQIMLHFRDLTEAKKTDRIRSDFIANASHELRTPLASLTGFIETLVGAARNDPQARERFLKIMLEQAERMSRLIDDLLTLSRFETARGRASFVRTDLADVIIHVVDALRPMAAARRTVIEINRKDWSSHAMDVLGNRDELIQLAENLIQNAIKYGRDNGTVVVDVKPAEKIGFLKLEVRDNGPGIQREHLPRLVERFYRADVDQAPGKQGTGLGLSIVKHIVQRHSGRLKITSELGVGSSFVVELPLLPVIEKANAL